MNKDIISKQIVKEIIKTFFSLFFNKNVKDIEFLDKEFERVESRRADIVVLADNEIYHIELQTSYDSKMPLRMLRYYTDIKFNYDYPVNQAVIYLGNKKIKNSLKDKNLEYSFEIIDMKKIDCDIFLSKDDPNSLVLSILCDFKDKSKKDVIKYIIRKLYTLSKSDFKNYLIMLEEFSDIRNLKEIVKEEEMIFFKEVKLEDLPSYEIGIEKGMEKGMEKGVLSLYKYVKDIDLISKEFNMKKDKIIYILEKNGIKVKK